MTTNPFRGGHYRRLLAIEVENNLLQACLNFLKILDSVCLKKIRINIGLASHSR